MGVLLEKTPWTAAITVLGVLLLLVRLDKSKKSQTIEQALKE